VPHSPVGTLGSGGDCLATQGATSSLGALAP